MNHIVQVIGLQSSSLHAYQAVSENAMMQCNLERNTATTIGLGRPDYRQLVNSREAAISAARRLIMLANARASSHFAASSSSPAGQPVVTSGHRKDLRRSSLASSDGRSSTHAALVSFASTPLPAQPLQPSLSSARAAAHRVSAGRSSVSSSLVGVLKDELKYARESYRRYEPLLEGPPNDFDIEDEPGKNSFYLLRTFKDEEIVVEVNLGAEALESDEDEEDDDRPTDSQDGSPLSAITFEVQVAKGSQALMFECESNGEYLVIQRIALERADNDDEEDEEASSSSDDYLGPEFDDLDDTLQQAFVDYLEERGVTAELGEYIRLFAKDKTSIEYQAWLKRVQDFISA
ncbi:mitochondrial glycoprotein [Dunaliella salina]|uniref:Mitochondrial glycoprotein n=1 Tax=Dunaliella salina TaxID=3046 RepID=A0ABQ7H9I2_DUNSA|nr:mitochondrial glycoprotein [Dunaliella salina]|eukprot:KAF5843508.1 mitochondrial glycoprotein [Dunaliella salina]